MKELNIIQTTLSAPKEREVKNAQNKVIYTYRNCEDILEALKEPLKETKCTITITDEVVMVGNRIYIKATATITNEAGDSVSASAFAREPESLGNMTQPQVTGSTSSYARKYALNGLLAIDDNDDADAVAAQPQPAEKQQVTPAPGIVMVASRMDSVDLQLVKDAVVQCSSKEELMKLFTQYPKEYQAQVEFKNIFTARRKQLE